MGKMNIGILDGAIEYSGSLDDTIRRGRKSPISAGNTHLISAVTKIILRGKQGCTPMDVRLK